MKPTKRKKPSDEIKGEVIDGETGKAEPIPGLFGKDGRRIDLSNLRDVRIELARLYRMMDAGVIQSADGSRRAFVLGKIHDVIISAELETRLLALEGAAPLQAKEGNGLPARTLN